MSWASWPDGQGICPRDPCLPNHVDDYFLETVWRHIRRHTTHKYTKTEVIHIKHTIQTSLFWACLWMSVNIWACLCQCTADDRSYHVWALSSRISDSAAEVKANSQGTPANWKKMLSHRVLREGTPEIILITKKTCFNNTLPEVRNISISTEK